MNSTLIFDENNYTVESIELEGRTLIYRAYENILYAERPVDERIQRLSIYAPEKYFQEESIGKYNKETAPIFFPNTVGGYMPGLQERPGKNSRGEINSAFWALLHGYIVVSPGVRGRGLRDSDGKYIGMAPAGICDLKAAIRFLRHNAAKIPGDVEKIISNGTSAGGAMSSLLGTTGNHPDYEPYLEKMGAAAESDHIFAASCYCPITNLDHADMAYEWEFYGLNDYHGIKFDLPAPGEKRPNITRIDAEMTEEQKKLSALLKPQFPAYLNSLNLKDDNGMPLVLDKEGNGSFKEYVKTYVAESAQKELDSGTDLSDIEWMTIEEGKVKEIDFQKYILFRTRMKAAPAFDNVALGTPENELFGAPDIRYRHFTEFAKKYSTAEGTLAEEQQIKMMNPMYYIEDDKAEKAKHIRIRHGAVDRDTSLAISTMLTAKLRNNGIDAQLEFPWGKPHAGDYDLEELFTWIDEICN